MTIGNDIAAIVGPEYITDEPETLERYSRDSSFVTPRRPGYVAFPKDVEEVQGIVKYANENRISVTPRSSRTGFYGAGIPYQSGIIVDLSRMNKILEIDGVTDGPDNDYAAQAEGAIRALETTDLVVIHIEAPDEAAHGGDIDGKVAAIEQIDREVIGRLCAWRKDNLRLLVLPDHPTPIKLRTHHGEAVPFLLHGEGFFGNDAKRFTEAEAKKTGVFMEEGYRIMGKLVGKEAG